MEQSEKIPEGDALQNHFSMLVAFTAMERDLLIRQKSNNPSVKKRLKKVDFMLDEYAIKILERQSPYEC
jgi:hypothetical protein